MFDKSQRCLASRQSSPLDVPEAIGHLLVVGRLVNYHRQQECTVGRHQVQSVECQLPFETEISLFTIVGGRGDDRDEKCAIPDLAADRAVPEIPSPQLALVEPDLDAGRPQGFANPFGRPRIL
jgi:hypothetical protein